MTKRGNRSESVAMDSDIVVRQTISRRPRKGSGFAEFIASMPERYRQEFDRASARQHARIAAARGDRPIHADLFSHPSGPGLCIVAPDAPGLLSIISTGLMLEGFDISRADIYTRRTTAAHEAVDLFWVRRSIPERRPRIRDSDVCAVRSTLCELVSSGHAPYPPSGKCARAPSSPSETSVQFHEVRGAPWLTLKLESQDRPGLLAAVTVALASERVQIVDSRVRTHGRRVYDYFDIVESDGSRPVGIRLQRIQLAVLTAVDGEPFAAGTCQTGTPS